MPVGKAVARVQFNIVMDKCHICEGKEGIK